MSLQLRVVDPGDCAIVLGETKVCTAPTYTIGRAAENDWVLQDAARYVSKHHCRIERTADGYRVVDTSTNGVYLGESLTPIGRGNSEPVVDGTLLNLGSCTVRFEINDAVGSFDGPTAPGTATAEIDAPFPGGTLDRTRNGAIDERSAALGFDAIAGTSLNGSELPAHIDVAGFQTALPIEESAEEPSPIQSFFRLPQAGRPAIPPDWEAEPAVEEPVLAALQPELDRGGVEPLPSGAFSAPDVEPTPFRGTDPTDPVSGRPVMRRSSDAGTALPMGEALRLIQAFLDGAALPADVLDLSDPVAAMYEIGAAFREAIGGIRDLLEFRAMLKAEFRMEHTRVQARDNNPLKFSTNLDGALAVMLGRRVPGFMGPSETVRESLRDVKAHEIAMMAGLRAALAHQLRQLAPAQIQALLAKGGGTGLLPSGRKARLWERYEQLHEQLASEELAAGAAGREFVEAYSNQYHKI